MTGRGLLAIGILIFQLAASARAADDLAAGVKDLLATGLKPSARALAAARTQYAALSKRPDFDARAKYAFALVLVEQRQLAEARQVLDEVLAERPEMLPAWQAKIWADLVSRSYPAALGDMRAAAAALEKLDPSSGDTVADDRRALAERMGRGFGFLMATGSTKIRVADLAAGRDEIFEKVGIDQPSFLIAQQTMAAEIAAIDEKLAAAVKERAAAAEKQQEQRADRKRVISKQVAEAEFETLKTQANGDAQVRSTDWEVEQIQRKLAKTQFDAKAVEMAITTQNQFITLQTEAMQRTGQNNLNGAMVIGSPQWRLQQLQNNASRLLQQRLALESQIEGLKTQLNAALMMRDGQTAESQQTSDELAVKAARLKQQAKRMDSALKHSSASPQAGKSTSALTEQRRSFSSFEPLGFEQEQERVVAWFEH